MMRLRERITLFIDRYVAALLILVTLISVGITVLLQQRAQHELVRSIAIHHANNYSTVLREFRTLYTSEVVERVRANGVKVTHDYRSIDGAIPLPATLSMLLGSRLTEQHSIGTTRLYSAYPFPWRQEDGGLRDVFSQAAWKTLAQDPNSPFHRFEEHDGKSVLRYAVADRMRPSCVDCHNSHAQTPKNDWKVGDVRGVIEVTVPLDASSQAAASLQRQQLPILAVLAILGCTGLFLLITLLRNSSTEKSRAIYHMRYAKELESEIERRRRVESAVEHIDEMVMITDTDATICYVNPAFSRVTGYDRDDVIGKTPRVLKSDRHDRVFYRNMWQTIIEGSVWKGYLINRKKDGTYFEEFRTISPVRDTSGRTLNFVAVGRDATKEQTLQSQLRQAQKVEAIGQLAAGIAHEINTPTQYVNDNTRFLKESFEKIFDVISHHTALIKAVKSGTANPGLLEKIDTAHEEADLEFLKEEVPKAIHESLEGIDRVAKIVRAMKNFSHPGEEGKRSADINEALESTIAVSCNEWKYVADIVTNYDENLPQISCYPAELNQAFLNLIVNAAHAIGGTSKQERAEKGTIDVQTRLNGNRVEIQISDSGSGIPDEIRERIFEPFFTTKEVGKGTGQGLAIVHSVIVELHGGTVEIETETGQGTTFILRLPVEVEES